MNNLVGQTLERYQILALLGEGGMGAVYKAHDITLQRDVAIKILHSQFARRADFRERFLLEARTAARLNHPGIVQVHDFGQENEILYIVMEFIPGDNLYQILQDLRKQEKWMRLDESVELIRQVCLALDYAHRQGILHRDIKPGNIMIKPDPAEFLSYRPVITDLGLAKLLEGQSITQEGTSLGTPPYMSPEQAMGQKTDQRSDVYSLGILLYELVVGQLPFPIRSLTEAMRYHTTELPPPPRSVRPDLPLILDKTILVALEKDPNRRPPNAGEFAKGLKVVLSSLEETPTAPTALGEVVSLVTQYQASLIHPRGSSVLDDFEQPSDMTNDRIQVLVDGKTTQSVMIRSGGMTIGRDQECGLVLDDKKASRKHAKLDYDGMNYRITDLNSSNGTYLNNVKLLPGVSEVWSPEKPLRIGDTWMRLLHSQAAMSGFSIVRTDGSLVDPSLVRSSQGQGRVAVFVEQAQFDVEPGRSISIPIQMLNQGSVVDHFRISVRGLPNAWIPASPPSVQLMPGAQEMVVLTIQPPRTSQTRAGDYNFALRVVSEEAPSEAIEQTLSLRVGVFSGFTSDFHPQRLMAGKSARLTVRNQGNRKGDYRLSLRDRAEEVAFQPPQITLEVEEGKSASAEFSAAPRSRRWLGSDQVYPFTVQVTAPAGETQTHTGELVSRALLPGWVVPVLLMVCILLGGSGALAGYYTYSQQQIAVNNTATADAFLVAQVAMNMSATADVERASQIEQATASAVSLAATASAGTQAAATALAESDEDNDGLSLSKELEYGTDPKNPDTDGDGLLDGEEVYKYGTNPTMWDTDGDNISDGEEIERGLNPLNPDTDGDGLPDNIDPDPNQRPTATPRPPPDGVSMNCDGSYQRYRLKETGSGAGPILVLDLWRNEQWSETWTYSPDDLDFHTIDIATAGFYEFRPCQTLLVIPVRAQGTGSYLDLNIFYWTGNSVERTFTLTSMSKGGWNQQDTNLFVEYAVYLYGEPEAAPCNTVEEKYVWNNGVFGKSDSLVKPTYEGAPPPVCQVAASPTLTITAVMLKPVIQEAIIFQQP
jgi:eukaryotic-like serine/threonine-protein kinase